MIFGETKNEVDQNFKIVIKSEFVRYMESL